MSGWLDNLMKMAKEGDERAARTARWESYKQQASDREFEWENARYQLELQARGEEALRQSWSTMLRRQVWHAKTHKNRSGSRELVGPEPTERVVGGVAGDQVAPQQTLEPQAWEVVRAQLPGTTWGRVKGRKCAARTYGVANEEGVGGMPTATFFHSEQSAANTVALFAVTDEPHVPLHEQIAALPDVFGPAALQGMAVPPKMSEKELDSLLNAFKPVGQKRKEAAANAAKAARLCLADVDFAVEVAEAAPVGGTIARAAENAALASCSADLAAAAFYIWSAAHTARAAARVAKMTAAEAARRTAALAATLAIADVELVMDAMWVEVAKLWAAECAWVAAVAAEAAEVASEVAEDVASDAEGDSSDY